MRKTTVLLLLLMVLTGHLLYSKSGRYIVVLKKSPMLLESGTSADNIIRSSVRDNGSSLLKKLAKIKDRQNQENLMLDVNSPAPKNVSYKELWLVNSILVDADNEVLEEIKTDESIDRIIPDFEVTLEDYIDHPVEMDEDIYEDEEKILNWGVRFIKAPEAWEQFAALGQSITVGVLDTGVNSESKVLKGKIALFKDFADPNATAGDSYGHGTHVSGIIVGGSFKKQVIGVAPESKIIFGKVFDVEGKSFYSVIISALQWMSDPDGDPKTKDYPVAINCSFRVPVPEEMTEEQVLDEFNKIALNLLELGIIPVKSSGNSGSETDDTITMPGYSPNFFTVGAVDPEGDRTDFSSVGKPGKTKPDVMAPGKKIFSAKNDKNDTIVCLTQKKKYSFKIRRKIANNK